MPNSGAWHRLQAIRRQQTHFESYCHIDVRRTKAIFDRNTFRDINGIGVHILLRNQQEAFIKHRNEQNRNWFLFSEGLEKMKSPFLIALKRICNMALAFLLLSVMCSSEENNRYTNDNLRVSLYTNCITFSDKFAISDASFKSNRKGINFRCALVEKVMF